MIRAREERKRREARNRDIGAASLSFGLGAGAVPFLAAPIAFLNPFVIPWGLGVGGLVALVSGAVFLGGSCSRTASSVDRRVRVQESAASSASFMESCSSRPCGT